MKKEYLQTICNKLNERGFTTYDSGDLLSSERQPFSVDSGEVSSFIWLPEENLKKIAEYDGYSVAKDFRSLYQAWGREGFFKFTPYVVEDSCNDTLCLRHNKFLHMFRGYYYQISDTPEGCGDSGHSLMRTDNFINLMRDSNYARSHLGFIILYSSLIDCGFQNDNFRTLFYQDKSAVDEYFRKSLEYWDVKFTYGYDVICKYITYKDGSINTADNKSTVYCFRDKHGILCRFWLSPEAVEVEYCYDIDNGVGKSRIVRFDIPDPVEGIDIENIKWWTDNDTEDLRFAFNSACFRHNKIEYFVLLMLLKLIGVHSNYIATYPIRKIGYIKEDISAVSIEKFDGIEE